MENKIRRVRKYDHRLRQLVYSTGDIAHATRHGVPRSTARGWLKPDTDPVVSVDVVDMDAKALQREVVRLEQRVATLSVLLRVVFALLHVSGFSLGHSRLPDGAGKRKLLHAIDRASSVLPLRSILRVLRLSHSRYYAWKREGECGLDDVPSCPHLSPQQLTSDEVETIRKMVTSTEYRHMTTGTLAVLAQRLG